MALRLRRGTDLERQAVIFAEGELVYTTDTKSLFVGDGQTLGGILISGDITESPDVLTRDLDLNSYNITGAGDVSISGVVTATQFVGDGSGLTNLNTLDVVEGGFYSINIVGSDSSVIVDRETNTFNGLFVGDLVGSLKGTVLGDDSSILVNSATNQFFGNFIGDGSLLTNVTVTGTINASIVGDDSSLIVDTTTNTLRGDLIGKVIDDTGADLLNSTSRRLDISVIQVDGEPTRLIEFLKLDLSTDLSTDLSDRGRIFFSREDQNGKQIEAIIAGGRDSIYFIVDNGTGSFSEANTVIVKSTGNTGIGTYTPSEKLEVAGNCKVSGFVQFGNLTSAERNALTPQNGMVIYNSSVERFQGYQNGAWINLDDGSVA